MWCNGSAPEARLRTVGVAVLESDRVDAAARVALHRLWATAFGDRFELWVTDITQRRAAAFGCGYSDFDRARDANQP